MVSLSAKAIYNIHIQITENVCLTDIEQTTILKDNLNEWQVEISVSRYSLHVSFSSVKCV